MILLSLIAFGIAWVFPFVAKGDDVSKCTQESLNGSYGYVLSGPLVGVGPVAAVGLTTFDGKGGLTTQDTVSTNGVISRRIGTGSYTMMPSFGGFDANCLGSAEVGGDFGGLTFDFRIVPGSSGRELSFIVTNPGTVQTGVAMATADEGCTLDSLQGTYRGLQAGTNPTGPVAGVGFIIADGQGNLSLPPNTVSVNGVISHQPVRSGTYTVNSDCTATVATSVGSTFDGVVVAGGNEGFFVRTNPNMVLTVLVKK